MLAIFPKKVERKACVLVFFVQFYQQRRTGKVVKHQSAKTNHAIIIKSCYVSGRFVCFEKIVASDFGVKMHFSLCTAL